MLGTKKNKLAKQAPISSHPFFAAVVALWFAALLGFGSLVLPVALFEKAVTATGISSIISAAQPPLGATARIAIAVFAAIAGAVAGLLIARKVASAQVEAPPERNVFGKAKPTDDADSAIKMPILAHEELGSESLDEPIAPNTVDPAPSGKTYSGKRRSLAVTDDSGPSDYFENAPLPGGEMMLEQFVDASPEENSEDTEDMQEVEPAEAFEAPLELAEIATEEALGDVPESQFDEDPIASLAAEPTMGRGRAFDAPGAAPFTDSNSQSAAIDPVADLREELGTMPDQSEPATPAIPAGYNPLGGTVNEPLNEEPAPVEQASNPFAAPAMSASISDSVDPEVAEEAPIPQQVFQTAPVPSEPEFTPAITDKSLTDLGMVELVERFALALQAKADAKAQEQAEQEAEAAAAPLVFQRSSAASAAPFAPSEAEEAGDALAQFFAPPASDQAADTAPMVQAEPVAAAAPVPVAIPASIPASMQELAPQQEEVAVAVIPTAPVVPASMQPVGFDENDEGEDDTASLSLSLNTAHQPFVQSGAPAADATTDRVLSEFDDEEGEDESAEYSSLLAMKSPFASGQEFVRIEDEPEEHGGDVEPTVVFPGSERRATPAIDGPSRDPFPEAAPAAPTGVAPALRPFDAPGQAKPSGLAISASSDDTERALCEALEKLQRMSGAA